MTPTRTQRRTAARQRRAILRARTAANRLTASVRRRPRSLVTHVIASGIDRHTATGVANGLRAVAKRLGIAPAATARTRRTATGGRSHQTHTVHRYTRPQVRTLAAAYRPRKTEYRTATGLLLAA
jgi:hypothetical protein